MINFPNRVYGFCEACLTEGQLQRIDNRIICNKCKAEYQFGMEVTTDKFDPKTGKFTVTSRKFYPSRGYIE